MSKQHSCSDHQPSAVNEASAGYRLQVGNATLIKPGYKMTEVGVIPEEWEVRRLRDFATIATGSTPPTADAANYGDEFLFVGPVDMGNTKQITHTAKRLSKKGFSISRRFPKDSILFVCIGSTIGKCGMASTELTSNQQINAIFPSETFCSDFLYYGVSAAAPRVTALAGEQAVPLVNKSQFSETQVALPPLPEQRAIAAALGDVDALLDGLERLIAKKRDLKQAAMQQLLTGQTRLPGFSGEWKLKAIQDIGHVGRGRVISHIEIARSSSPDYPVYSSQTSNSGVMGYIDTYEFEGDYVTWTTDGANAGTVFARTGRFNCTNVCGTIKLHGSNHRFIAAVLGQSTQPHVSRHLGNPKLMNDVMKKIEILIPIAIEEQTAIAAILSDMDAELTALQTRRDKTRALKQGMMQELLTGRTRLL
ncbi:restriction endonuclease subunit S [Methylomonas sp. EFPC1]|uniref:restriction endonuclease subunit S n=1 Tax=Methylomonas sp. EFPC1 TaxID=2812647 RepID=UPI001967EC88|nr:restriction endonuclease subunit S [Methylomonas sp. EFPC1]QSB02021.1 restriction endonuclease subunit S [Methylomonas sp. EFPC1]